MGGIAKKKGTSGSSKNFVTRDKALKKLQLNLSDFRKLCILKGIYPREPKVKFSGLDKSYYHLKDINFIIRDPLIDKFREHANWKKRVKRAKGRNEYEKVKKLMENEPEYSLFHLVKERYPTFMDAIKDLNEILTLMYLFVLMPVGSYVKPGRIESCSSLLSEYEYYISHTHSLRKVFISIKGTYFQAELFGHRVTWICPHRFNDRETDGVDMKVMSTFLEFYEVVMGFINYKLYNTLGLKYPPKISKSVLQKDRIYDALKTESINPILKKVESSNAVATDNKNKISSSDNNNNNNNNIDNTTIAQMKESELRIETIPNILSSIENVQEIEQKNQNDDEDDEFESENKQGLLFSNCVFYVSREVPIHYMEFILRSMGAKIVSYEGGLLEEDSPKITHHIVDRGPNYPINRRLDREYVQPQWVFDSVNAQVLLPIEKYTPEATLPPHLSPFVATKSRGYIPDYKKEIDIIVCKARNLDLPSYHKDEHKQDLEDSEDDENIYARELAEETGRGDDQESEDQDQESKDQDQESKDQDQNDEDSFDELTRNTNKKLKRAMNIQKTKKRGSLQEEMDTKRMAESMLPRKQRKILYNNWKRAKRLSLFKLSMKKRKEDIESGKYFVNKQGKLVTSKEVKV